jgi:xylulokinase
VTQRYLVGVDLGTSATKATLYTTEGAAVAEAAADVPLHHPYPGAVEQEMADFYATAAETVRRCVADAGIDPRDVASIAFASQMAGIGAVDEDFAPAARFDSWLDMRCQPYIEEIDRNHGDLVTRLTGCPPTCDHGPKILWWQHERPQEYARMARFVVPSGYVAGKMAGLKADDAFIDYTFLHFTALSDAQAGTWSDELTGRLGVDSKRLPRIVPPWQVVGEVSDAAAADFGLAPGTPIAAGCGDTAAGALGAGIVEPGMLFDTAGTASVLAGCADQFVADVEHRALLTMRSVAPGLWHPLAYIAGGGLALRWYRENFYRRGAGDGDLYDEMTEAAAAVAPGAEGLFFSPHLGGRICPATPAMRGAWVGFSWGHGRGHFARAILEGVAFEYAYYLKILRELIPDLRLVEARVIGGGARSARWNQIKADVLNVPYQRLAREEFGTWGAALIAGHAVGLFPNLAEAACAAAERRGQPFTPQPQAVAAYERLIPQYIRWEDVLCDAFRVSSVE